MHRKSHIYFAISLTPIFFIPIKKETHIFFIDKFINSYNNFIDFTFQIIQHPINNLGLILVGVILYILGSIFPDIDFKIKKFLPKDIASKSYYYHRQFTHSLLLWLLILYFSIMSFSISKETNIILWLEILFVLGSITHLIADMLTGTIPWLLYGHYGKLYSRIGITTFFPNTKKSNNPNDKSLMNYFFTRKLPNLLEKKFGLLIFSLLFLFNLFIFFKTNHII